jgi:hypothetical protein
MVRSACWGSGRYTEDSTSLGLDEIEMKTMQSYLRGARTGRRIESWRRRSWHGWTGTLTESEDHYAREH